MSHSKINNIIAGVVFAISFVVYWSTVAPTTSFWDCGEFIACSYILGVPHPPGAPLYILIGRIFSMFSFLAEDVALRVNLTSPIFSAFSAMFTYLIIVRLILLWKEKPRQLIDQLSVYGGGVIGALAFAFSDSQWFNSVEAEVYAGSMFFTAIVIWLILKWMDHADSPYSDRYILLIFYINSLAIGVHLLNLLALPVIAMIAYTRLSHSQSKFSLIEILKLLGMAGAGAIIMGIIYRGVVKGIPNLLKASSFSVVGFVFVLLLVLAAVFIQRRNRFAALGMMSIVLVVVGYSTYTAIFVRSSLDPVIDENNPDTPARLVSYLNREQYGDWSIAERREPLWEYQIKKMYIRYFGWQYIGKGTTLDSQGRIVENISLRGLLGLPFLIGMIGFFHHFSKDWRRGLSILTLFVMTGFAIVIYLNQEDPQPRERDYAYTGSFFAFALWIGIGASAIIEYVREAFSTKKSSDSGVGKSAVDQEGRIISNVSSTGTVFASVMAGLLLFSIPGNMFRFNYDTHDRTGNYVAYDYSYNILQSCEENAILFTNGDNDTFPLWFLQYVHNIRPDVRVVNLSLLNTPWYIKQLKYDEPRVAINWSDDKIEALQAQPWKTRTVPITVTKETYDKYYQKATKIDSTIKYDENHDMSIEVKPTLFGQAIRVQDIMILKILQDNQFRRPVYFAVTVSPQNKLGLDPYMRMDGLAFRVMPVKVKGRRFVDPDIMWTALNEKFRYRNLDNPDVYYNDNIMSLLQNYRSAFFQLAQYYLERDDKQKALEVLDRMGEAIPEDVIPPNDFRITEAIGYMYSQAGRPEEMDKRYTQILSSQSEMAARQKIEFANYFNYRGQKAIAESLALEVLQEMPDNAEIHYWLGRFYNSIGEKEKAIAILEDWLAKQPNDVRAKSDLNVLKGGRQRQAPADSATDSAGPPEIPETGGE